MPFHSSQTCFPPILLFIYSFLFFFIHFFFFIFIFCFFSASTTSDTESIDTLPGVGYGRAYDSDNNQSTLTLVHSVYLFTSAPRSHRSRMGRGGDIIRTPHTIDSVWNKRIAKKGKQKTKKKKKLQNMKGILTPLDKRRFQKNHKLKRVAFILNFRWTGAACVQWSPTAREEFIQSMVYSKTGVKGLSLSICVSMYVSIYISISVSIYQTIYVFIHIHMYIHLYIYVCVCVCFMI